MCQRVVYAAPFNGRDLGTVSDAELTAVQNMRVAAENAEVRRYGLCIRLGYIPRALTTTGNRLRNSTPLSMLLRVTLRLLSRTEKSRTRF